MFDIIVSNRNLRKPSRIAIWCKSNEVYKLDEGINDVNPHLDPNKIQHDNTENNKYI